MHISCIACMMMGAPVGPCLNLLICLNTLWFSVYPRSDRRALSESRTRSYRPARFCHRVSLSPPHVAFVDARRYAGFLGSPWKEVEAISKRSRSIARFVLFWWTRRVTSWGGRFKKSGMKIRGCRVSSKGPRPNGVHYLRASHSWTTGT